MPHQQFEFINRRGLTLSAQLDAPSEAPAATHALFAHCFTCGKDIKAAYYIARALNRAGIGVLRAKIVDDDRGIREGAADICNCFLRVVA